MVKEGKRIWTTRFMAVLWNTWKQTNDTIFREKRVHPVVLATRIREETELWLFCCRRGHVEGAERRHIGIDNVVCNEVLGECFEVLST